MSVLSSEYRLQGSSLSGFVLCPRETGETHESERIQQYPPGMYDFIRAAVADPHLLDKIPDGAEIDFPETDLPRIETEERADTGNSPYKNAKFQDLTPMVCIFKKLKKRDQPDRPDRLNRAEIRERENQKAQISIFKSDPTGRPKKPLWVGLWGYEG